MPRLVRLCAVVFTSISLFGNADCFNCFSCSNKTNDEDCSKVVQCAANEVCFVERNGRENTTKFNLGCINSQHCPSHRPFSIVGRATNDRCFECCGSDGCNREMCEVQDIPAVMTPKNCEDDPQSNCSRMAILINICSDMQAKQLCRKYCGLCNQVDGGWAAWYNWSSCSTSCGIGVKTRRRTCSKPVPQHGGINCPGNNTQVHSCFDRACPVELKYVLVQLFQCTESGAPGENGKAALPPCGIGVRKRHRACTNPTPSLYGRFCLGDGIDYDICTGHACGNTTTTTTAPTTTQTIHCFDVLHECSVLNQTTGICNEPQRARTICPEFCGFCSVADGYWASWLSWGTCSTTCGNGTWTRSRTCTNPAPSKGGKPCTGTSTDTGFCYVRRCPVHGNWSPWADWTPCSSSCGQGLTHRRRTCTNPRPSFDGNSCFGDPTEYNMCLVRQCQANPIPTIVFNANSVTTASPSTGQPLVFSSVTSNIGNAYNATTGTFTAPINGTYSFSVVICVSTSKSGRFNLVRDGSVVTGLYVYGYGSYSTQSVTVAVFLKQGQMAWVKAEYYCSACLYNYSTCQNRFSGSLVHI